MILMGDERESILFARFYFRNSYMYWLEDYMQGLDLGTEPPQIKLC